MSILIVKHEISVLLKRNKCSRISCRIRLPEWCGIATRANHQISVRLQNQLRCLKVPGPAFPHHPPGRIAYLEIPARGEFKGISAFDLPARAREEHGFLNTLHMDFNVASGLDYTLCTHLDQSAL